MLKSPKIIASIGFVALLVTIMSFFLSSKFIANEKNLVTQVEEVEPVTSEFDYLNKAYFTNNPLNPTKDITIQTNNNTQPLPTEQQLQQ